MHLKELAEQQKQENKQQKLLAKQQQREEKIKQKQEEKQQKLLAKQQEKEEKLHLKELAEQQKREEKQQKLLTKQKESKVNEEPQLIVKETEAIEDNTPTPPIETKPVVDTSELYQKAILQMRRANWEEAITLLNQAIDINPNDSKLYTNKGIIKSRLGKAEEACQNWNTAQELGDKSAKTLIQINGCE